MCEWTDCPDKPTLRARSAYLPSSVLLAFVAVKITVTLGNGKLGHASACLCHNAAWRQLNVHGMDMNVQPDPCGENSCNLEGSNLYFKALPMSKWQCIVGGLNVNDTNTKVVLITAKCYISNTTTPFCISSISTSMNTGDCNIHSCTLVTYTKPAIITWYMIML